MQISITKEIPTSSDKKKGYIKPSFINASKHDILNYVYIILNIINNLFNYYEGTT